MALARAYRICCDQCYRGLAFRETSREARKAAIARGWKRTPKKDGNPGRDLCERCAAGSSTENGEPRG
jgi:hypothetical protein